MSFFTDIKNSYLQFRDNHSGIMLSGPNVTDASGAKILCIERQSMTPQLTRFDGWADADRVVIYDKTGQEVSSTVPHIPRPDVQRLLGKPHDRLGFTLSTVQPPRNLRMVVVKDGIEIDMDPAAQPLISRVTSELRLNRRYLRTLTAAAPDIWRWLRHRDRDARLRAGRVFRAEGDAAPVLRLDALTADPWPEVAQNHITIVVPVYQGLHLIDPVLTRVRDHTDLPWHLIVVDDASPDPEVQTRLRSWQQELTEDRMTLIAAPENQGFVGSANLGLAAAVARGHDVVLLNSDALVPHGWASRLLQPMRAMPRVASVTPFSNDAEIANVPKMGTPVALEPGEADTIDQAATTLHLSSAAADVPTGVGFCMAMNIEALRENPQLDTAFGRGYGEEVDWCQKAAAQGWRNLLTAGLFVEHQGGQTFGSEAKMALIRQNGAIISERYPQFDAEVQAFMATDPLAVQRLLLGIRFATERAAGRGRRLSVFLGHGMGGGAEIYLAQRIQAEVEQTGHAVVLRVMPDASWQLELHSPAGITCGTTRDISDLLPIFGNPHGLDIIYSCGVGAPRPLDIPKALLALASYPDMRLEVTFNDYFPISPSYTLLDSTGAFTMPPAQTDPAHRFVGPDGHTIGLADWQKGWGQLMERADQLTVFSKSSAEIVGATWPRLVNRIALRPHKLPEPVPAMPATRDDGPVIGVLGNISRAKGAEVLSRLSAELARTGAGKIVLIGNIEPGFKLERPSLSTGSYQVSQLPQLVARHGITRWYFPSIWPETFSYVVHEMIATGLPVWSFDIGAQRDAVANALQAGQKGGVLPLEGGNYDVQAIVKTITAA